MALNKLLLTLKNTFSLFAAGMTIFAFYNSFSEGFSATAVAGEISAVPEGMRAEVPAPTEASPAVPFTLRVEYHAGLTAWLPVDTLQLSANASEDTQVIVPYAGETYAVNFNIRAQYLAMHDGKESWQINVTRIDTLSGKPITAPVSSELVLDRNGPGLRLVTHGRYHLQNRDIRLGFTLN